jgi:glycosyltransferase involved in cell wall biosynthesis
MIGDGLLRQEAQALPERADLAGLPGERNDVPEVLHGVLFVPPSLAEGVSNTILEAMATDVGGNGELIEDGKTGRLPPPGDAPALALAVAAPACRLRGPLRERARDAVPGPRLAENGWFGRDYNAPLWTPPMFEAFPRKALDEDAPPAFQGIP